MNAGLPAVSNANTNTIAATDHGSTPSNVPPRPDQNYANRVDRTKLEARSSDTPPPLQFQPADEDSEFATAMNSAGAIYEVRIFKKHPRLARVESTWTGPKERQLKITLNDGQVREVKTDRVQSLKQATSAQLVTIGGL
jgi:hypothetical protein